MSQAFEIFLIRHAQSANNARPESQRVEDPSITELGFQQADELAKAYDGIPFTHVLTSGFRRALQTTRPLAQRAGVRPAIRTDIHEVGGCFRGYLPGQLEGRPGLNRSSLQHEFSEFSIPDDIGGEGWWKCQPHESFQQAQQRADRQANLLCEEFRGTGAVVGCVIHADFKDLLLRSLLRESYAALRGADLLNTGVTHLLLSGEAPEVVRFNDAAHLSEELWTS